MAGLLVLVAFALLAAALWWRDRTTVTVWEWETGLLFHNGRFERTLPPGRYPIGLLGSLPGRTVVHVSTTRRLLVVPMQEVLTADSFPVKLGAVLHWHVVDARLHHAATAGTGGQDQLQVAVQLALRAAAGTRTLDALLAARAETGALEAEMLPAVTETVAWAGGTVEQLALRDLVLPAEVRRMVTEAERARREGLAALERARGEQAALRSLANAARLLRGNPELQALRTLQALSAAPGRPAPTLVLGVPPFMPVPSAQAPMDPGGAPDPAG